MASDIIPRVPLEELKQELTDDKRLRLTNRCDNIIYVVTWQDSPHVVREIGRLREIAFRTAGGGTGQELDLDEFDTCEHPYRQLIVWDPRREEILGGYRFRFGSETELDEEGQPRLATSHMFHFSPTFVRDYLPFTIELGRSFVVREYQQTRKDAKALFVLDNLWEGLGALVASHPSCRYLLGKFTMYPQYDKSVRDLIFSFLKLYFPDGEQLVKAKEPITMNLEVARVKGLFCGTDYRSDYKVLSAEVRRHGLTIPPLVNAYMNLSPTMKLFGTAINDLFGDVEETGMLITVDEIWPEKRARYIESFSTSNNLTTNI